METVITPKKIDFLKWKISNTENTIMSRCYINDKYAAFVLSHLAQQEIKEHFPNLLNSIQERAAQNHAGAQCNLGFMYKKGTGVQKDEEETVRLYRLAADQGHPTAQCTLGIMHEEGRGGLKKDHVELSAFISSQPIKARAQSYLGAMYEQGRCGLQKDLLNL